MVPIYTRYLVYICDTVSVFKVGSCSVVITLLYFMYCFVVTRAGIFVTVYVFKPLNCSVVISLLWCTYRLKLLVRVYL